jgi:hypothetical protein
MKKLLVITLVLCFVLALVACHSSRNTENAPADGGNAQINAAENLRDELKKHEFLGVTFYLPSEFTQSNIFADTDTGRISFTNPQGITVMVNVNEASYIQQYFDKEISDAQSYAQVYYDSYSTETSDEDPPEVKLSSQYSVPYIRLCGNMDGTAQFGFMGYYYSGAYCACVAVYVENESAFDQNEKDMLNFATIATFSH